MPYILTTIFCCLGISKFTKRREILLKLAMQMLLRGLVVQILVCIFFVAFLFAEHQNIAFPDYFEISDMQIEIKNDVVWLEKETFDDYALWRFDDIRPRLGDDKGLRLSFVFMRSPTNDKNKEIRVRVIYTNPKTGMCRENNINITIDDKGSWVGSDLLPFSFLDEERSLIIRIERLKQFSSALGVAKDSIFITNIDRSSIKEIAVYTEGVLMPTAYTSKNNVFARGPFVKRPLEALFFTTYFPRGKKVLEDKHSVIFSGLEIRCTFLREKRKKPAGAIGVVWTYPLVYRPMYENRGYGSFYGVISKTFHGVFNVNFGWMRGNIIDMLVYANIETRPSSEIKSLIFGSTVFHVAPWASFLFETGYDINSRGQIALWAFSAKVSKYLSVAPGIAYSMLNTHQIRDLFLTVKMKW